MKKKELNEENVYVLKYSEKNYEIKIQLVTINKESFIRIIAQEEKKLVNYNYQIDMNKEDFIKYNNVMLRPYREIQDFYNFILGSFNEKEIWIKDIKNKISFILMIKGKIRGYSEPFTFEISLKKNNCCQDDIEEMICKKTNELEKENNNLKQKVNALEEENNNLKHKINTLEEKEKLKFEELKKEIQKLKLDFKELGEEYKLKNKSNEIIQSEQELKFIKNRLLKIPGRENSNISLELKYKMTEDGDSIKTFHSKCDNIPNNLVLYKSSSGARFGGYTDKPWTSRSNGSHIQDKNCFCFSLSKNKIYNVLTDKNAIYDSYNYGPSFSNFFGINSSNDLLSSGYCHECTQNNKGSFSEVNTPYEINNGNSNFTALELEFYHVIFK